MDIIRLIDALSDPAAYPHPVDRVDICQTHISVVFLAGDFAYKIKKPVNLGFVDFSSVDLRRHFCHEEVRLNRRLAPSVYLGVVPIVRDAGAVRVEGRGETVEWAVKMTRLPREQSLEHRLEQGDVGEELVRTLAQKVAAFHASAAHDEHIAAFGQFGVVARNARENFSQAVPQIGTIVRQTVFDRLRALTERSLAQLRPLIERRAAAGMTRDAHGDLRLEHVYLLAAGQTANHNLAIIDCVEFNERFRFADPVADVAFLVMDLAFHGRRDLANAFAAEYFRASGDADGKPLLPFYTAYRATVRAKVEGLELLEQEIPEAERTAAAALARAHWLLALGQLEDPGSRPCLVLVAGLPGTGKSALAQGLACAANLQWIRSDAVRKELAGLAPDASAAAPFGEGIYSDAWSERSYAECLRRAESLLFDGQRVVIDASFGHEHRRHDFLQLAKRLAVPAAIFVCTAEPDIVRGRLQERRGDASDADWAIFEQALKRWQEPTVATRRFVHEISTAGKVEKSLSPALGRLSELELISKSEI